MIDLVNGQWVCTSHDPTQLWCDHIKEMIENGKDADEYHLGSRLQVPIFPSNDIWAPVVIGSEPVVARSGMIHMEYQPDIGNVVNVQLGLWNPGEGMMSMRTVIRDYIQSRIHPDENLTSGSFKTTCPNGAHSIKSSTIMDAKCDEPGWKWQCLWNMVMEKACTPCIVATSGVSDDNFGIDDSVITKPRWS